MNRKSNNPLYDPIKQDFGIACRDMYEIIKDGDVDKMKNALKGFLILRLNFLAKFSELNDLTQLEIMNVDYATNSILEAIVREEVNEKR